MRNYTNAIEQSYSRYNVLCSQYINLSKTITTQDTTRIEHYRIEFITNDNGTNELTYYTKRYVIDFFLKQYHYSLTYMEYQDYQDELISMVNECILTQEYPISLKHFLLKGLINIGIVSKKYQTNYYYSIEQDNGILTDIEKKLNSDNEQLEFNDEMNLLSVFRSYRNKSLQIATKSRIQNSKLLKSLFCVKTEQLFVLRLDSYIKERESKNVSIKLKG